MTSPLKAQQIFYKSKITNYNTIAMIYVFVILLLIFFTVTLMHFHNAVSLESYRIRKVYIENHIIELINDELIVDGKNVHRQHTGRFDELAECLHRIGKYREIFSSPGIFGAINSFVKHSALSPYLNTQQITTAETLPFRPELNYGGVYFENVQDCALADVIGDARQIVTLCSKVHDQEEIIRIAEKWKKQGYEVAALATVDVANNKKNILKRGVKEKMTFLGLLAIAE